MECRQIDAVLFDLDGTLLDTAPDMAAALNRLLVEQNRAALPYRSLRAVVSHGSLGLITAGFGSNIEPGRLKELTQRFLTIYSEALAVNTVLFSGVSELLDAIEDRGLSWGIVTNKPKWLTNSVLEQMGIFAGAGCVISGDTLAQRKPHPAPLQHAASLLDADPQNCIYVGDAERDIEAGRAAGMLTLIAAYGYIRSDESPENWNADGVLAHPWTYTIGYPVPVPINTELLFAAGFGVLLGALLGVLISALLYVRRVARLEAERLALTSRLKNQEELATERALSLESATQHLRVAFDELAGKSLSSNSETFLRLARENLGQFQTQATAELSARQQAVKEIIKPITETLTSTREQLQRAEKERIEAFGAIDQQLKQVHDSHGLLQIETSKLVNALQRPDVGGQWGEITLRRLVELAGMVEHCDFVEQEAVNTDAGQLRPDMVVRLPDRGEIIIDAKTPMEGYLAATQATDDIRRKEALTRHAKNLRRRVRELAGKNYWAQFQHSPDFVVMFVPGDQFLGAALNHDPALLEDALKQRILLVTPTSLIALLKSIAYGWRHAALTDNAEKIRDLAEELYKRLAGFTEHVATLGAALNKSVDTYNRAVGSLERNVLPSARKFSEMGISERKSLAAVEPIDKTTRKVGATVEAVAKPEKDAG